LADASALKALGQLAEGNVDRQATDTLNAIFDELWGFFEPDAAQRPDPICKDEHKSEHLRAPSVLRRSAVLPRVPGVRSADSP